MPLVLTPSTAGTPGNMSTTSLPSPAVHSVPLGPSISRSTTLQAQKLSERVGARQRASDSSTSGSITLVANMHPVKSGGRVWQSTPVVYGYSFTQTGATVGSLAAHLGQRPRRRRDAAGTGSGYSSQPGAAVGAPRLRYINTISKYKPCQPSFS